eukprot:g32229.t1
MAFWVDLVGYSSAVAYGVLIPLFIAGLMVRQYFAVQEARLFLAHSKVEPQRAAAAAHLSVHCRGKIQVHLHAETVVLTMLTTHLRQQSSASEEEEMDAMKFFADEAASKNLDTLKSRKLTEMLTERILLSEAKTDRLLAGAGPLLRKYTLCCQATWAECVYRRRCPSKGALICSLEDIWMDVVMKLFAVALVSCVSMSNAWKWAVAFSLGMAVLVWVSHPFMHPQVSHLQSLSCFCLALSSVAFVYHRAFLARLALVAPLLLVLSQVRCPDCTEAMAERCYQELEAELQKLPPREELKHELEVQLLRF